MDIVENLRELKEYVLQQPPVHYEQAAHNCMEEAAAEITRLRDEVKELNSQLEFADFALSRFNSGEELQAVLRDNERLRARLAEAEKVIKPFVEILECADYSKFSNEYDIDEATVNLGDLRAAAKWMEAK